MDSYLQGLKEDEMRKDVTYFSSISSLFLQLFLNDDREEGVLMPTGYTLVYHSQGQTPKSLAYQNSFSILKVEAPNFVRVHR